MSLWTLIVSCYCYNHGRHAESKESDTNLKLCTSLTFITVNNSVNTSVWQISLTCNCSAVKVKSINEVKSVRPTECTEKQVHRCSTLIISAFAQCAVKKLWLFGVLRQCRHDTSWMPSCRQWLQWSTCPAVDLAQTSRR